jgi:hypothetical protein
LGTSFAEKIRILIFLPAGDSVVKIQVADDASAGVDSGFLSCGFESFQPLLRVGLRQPQAAAVLVDLEAHFAAVDFRDPTELRKFLRKTPQPLLQIRVVGGDLHCGIGLVEVNLSEFLLLVQMLFLRKLVASWLFRSGSRPGKESLFSDKSYSGDPLYHSSLLCRLISVFPGSRRENTPCFTFCLLLGLESRFFLLHPAGFRVFFCRAAALGKIILDFLTSLL